MKRTVRRWLRKLPGEHELVGTVASRWKAQYCERGKWSDTVSGSSRKIYDRLLDLAPDATEKDVAAIIGNDSWVGHWCNGCWNYSVDAWQIGDEPDYESATVVLCAACMRGMVSSYRRAG